ncbi:alpha/beta hydrolase [Bacteroidota bacterium]
MLVLKIIGIVFGSIIGIVLLYLIVVIFFPGFEVKEIPIEPTGDLAYIYQEPDAGKVVSFDVEGDKVHAWLYLPDSIMEPVGCIIMSNGFGGTTGMILKKYAMRYRDAGFATLLYDYRYFGESEGEPRQLFLIKNQIEDLTATIEYVRSLKEINPDKIALWGTSAAGGYGIIKASTDKKIACIVGQCPALDSKADGEMAVERQGIGFFLKLFVHAQRDMGRSRFGLSAHKIPIVGRQGEFAFLNAQGAYVGYSALVEPGFKNEVCARLILRSHGYNPIDYAKDVECPVLLQICEHDNLVSEKSYKGTAEILGNLVDVKVYPIGHFDIYTGENFEKAVSDQVEFFKKHMSL